MPILEWSKGIYDYAFIAPHPFFRVPGFGGLGSKPYPNDDLIKSIGQAISWSEVHRAVAPEESKEAVYLAVWLLSVLGFAERAGIDLQNRIEAYCKREGLYLPEEYGLSPILEPSVGQFLAKLGSPSVVAWDEFRDNSIEFDISGFNRENPAIYLRKSTTPVAFGGCISPTRGSF